MPTPRSTRRDVDYAPPPIDLSDDDLDELFDDDEYADVKPLADGLLSGALAKPRHVTTSCKSLHDLIHTGSVDLYPSYQRDVVWSELKMIGLIQSLFMNYYVPPVIFAIEQKDDGTEGRTCIDGKQRCTSILEFMDGKIPFVSPATKERLYYKRFANQRGKELPPNMRQRFDMIQIQAVEYDGIADDMQRDIFQRVQMGVALSAAEKLQAVPGKWTTWIMELLKKYVFQDNTLSDSMDWDVKRGRPFQHVASIVIMCFQPDSRKIPSSNVIKVWLERDDEPDDDFKRRIETAMALLVQISIDFHYEAFETCSTKRVAPVELWFIGYLIFTRMSVSTIETLAKQIGHLRKDVRSSHRDIFTNKTITDWLRRWIDKLPIKKAGRDEVVAAAEWEGEDPLTSDAIIKKRKRQEREDMEDPDYRGQAAPRGSRSDAAGNTRSSRQTNAASGGGSSSTAYAHATSLSFSQPQPQHNPPPVAVRSQASSMDAPLSSGGEAYNSYGNGGQGFSGAYQDPRYGGGVRVTNNQPIPMPQQYQVQGSVPQPQYRTVTVRAMASQPQNGQGQWAQSR